MIELKPCPFCLSTDVAPSKGWHSHFIECADCGCCGPSGERLEDAIDAWETRPEVGG